MPSVSKSQQRLFGAAAHGATFPKALQLRRSMTSKQLREFASTPRKGLPERKKRGRLSERLTSMRSAGQFRKSAR